MSTAVTQGAPAPVAAAGAATGSGAANAATVDLAAAWRVLGDVPDPEVPVVSVVELGIVRDLRADGAGVVVTVTPTYSGCPATDAIAAAIERALAARLRVLARVETVLAPAWTTAWLAPEARGKLSRFGIAPPVEAAGGCPAATQAPAPGRATAAPIDVAGVSPLRRAGVVVPCPRCGARTTRLLSQFGSTACKAQYRCDACLEPFDYFKPH